MIATDIRYLLAVYQQQTINLWEERDGYSFFARAVQLRCFSELASNSLGILVPAGVAEAIGWLQARLAANWNTSEAATPTTTTTATAPNEVGHPWVPCTANFAQLCHRLATTIRDLKTVPLDALSAAFFTRSGSTTRPRPRMLQTCLTPVVTRCWPR